MNTETGEPRIGHSRTMARNLLKKYQVKTPPISVETIIRGEKIVLSTVDYINGTCGESWWENGIAHIEVARRITPNRRRFTLAHELGHIVLRHHQLRATDLSFLNERFRDSDEDEDWEERKPKDWIEVEANQFAAELLMPLALFKKEWLAKPEHEAVAALALRYQVSQEATWWRIHGFLMSKG